MLSPEEADVVTGALQKVTGSTCDAEARAGRVAARR
jgi:hypothetical protein